MPDFDVVGVGLNATDTLLIVPHFPAYAGKVPFVEEMLSPGGQVASAMVACAKLGLRTKYIGAVGDDERGRIQMESLQGTGINLDHVMIRKGCANQSAYIIIDRSTGERTVLWRRDECLKVRPDEITEEMIAGSRMLHIDGHDTPAVARAADIARHVREAIRQTFRRAIIFGPSIWIHAMHATAIANPKRSVRGFQQSIKGVSIQLTRPRKQGRGIP